MPERFSLTDRGMLYLYCTDSKGRCWISGGPASDLVNPVLLGDTMQKDLQRVDDRPSGRIANAHNHRV